MGGVRSIRLSTWLGTAVPPPAGVRSNPKDACQPPVLRPPSLGAWRHVRIRHTGEFSMTVTGIATPAAPTATQSAAGPVPAVALRDVRKVHGRGDGAVVALDGISIDLSQ